MSNVSKGYRPPSPLKVLKSAEGQVVLVRIKGGIEYVGTLDLIDPTMNIVLSDCTEYSGDGRPTSRYGKIIIRGSHVEFISTNYGQVAPDKVTL
ncbi:MAG: U6 snRNA-associated Sm-like protein LSm6 [Desulfurococcus sp.]|jgi:small nuclear ribonucleoprotein|uniref:Small nuclear ribonucleoprotein, LSM family n=1 Tax=Desulfurococcus amylolyticus DSM 16532 TaxID=768672 RepID=I3XQ67_DESAM|nr:U6 snRNA-associated Sm-like protein LSm6 [Desulfurococcus amylolyticus]AFL66091.1 Small nuclear ribonucleoprotein, LSM family [Desulfurococcus amylolyticus DSM 16532]